MNDVLLLRKRIRQKKIQKNYGKKMMEKNYAEMFKPVTAPLKSLVNNMIPAIPPTSNLNAASSTPSTDNLNATSSTNNLTSLQPASSMSHTPSNIQIPADGNGNILKILNLNDKDDVDVEDDDGESLYEMYVAAPGSKEYGYLGLNSKKMTIGPYTYTVNGNQLIITDPKSKKKFEYKIEDADVWKLLIMYNPKGSFSKESLDKFAGILRDINLLRYIKSNKKIANRRKYQLITKAMSGSGFLFSTIGPKVGRGVNLSTVVIPCNKKKLVHDLKVSVAEMRAGNKSMRNIVVPLARRAKKLGILPKNLLSAKDLTWVYA